MIVELWKKVFHFLRYISVFEYIRKIPGLKGSHFFVEVWVLINITVPFVLLFLLRELNIPTLVAWIILIYSFTRVMEIIVYQVNVLLFDPYQSNNYSVKSYRRMVILLIHNYLEVVLWFATSYGVMSHYFGVKISNGGYIETLFFSFVNMVTFGSDNLRSFENIGQFVIFSQAIIGLFMTIVSLARFIGLLPKPNSMDQKEQENNLVAEIEDLKEKIIQLEKKVK